MARARKAEKNCQLSFGSSRGSIFKLPKVIDQIELV
jgi:hypothetical protein